MGGVIFVFLLALVIVILVTPALRARLSRQRPPSEPREETPHEVVIRRLDDHRARKNTPRDDATDKPR